MNKRAASPRLGFLPLLAGAGLILIASLLLTGRLFAGAVQAGNPGIADQLYETGQYGPAAQAYEQLADQGLRHPNLYYNLANAYLQQGDVGRAILNYRRAERLAPRDPDIQANLSLARQQVVDDYSNLEPAESGGLLDKLVAAIGQRTSLNELAAIALAAWLGLGLVLLAWLVIRSESGHARTATAARWLILVLAVVVLLSGLGLASRIYVEESRPAAVVVAGDVQVTNNPGPEQPVAFTLHSGAEVSLLERQGDYALVALPGLTSQGWVPAAAVEQVGEGQVDLTR